MEETNKKYNKTPLFHIGFPKAGSTMLQNQVFSRLSGTCFLGRHMIDERLESRAQIINRGVPYLVNKSVRKFYREFINKDGFNYDEEKAFTLLKEISEGVGEEIAIFSHEGVLNTLLAYPDAAIKAERIFRLFGKDLRILINIREQKHLIVSLYRHSPFDPYDVKSGKAMSIVDWINKEKRRKYSSVLDLLNYERTASLYTRLFGSENVLVLPLELMISNPQLYAEKLGEFMGTNVDELTTLLARKPANIGKSVGYNRLRQFRRNLPTSVRFRSFIPEFLYNTVINILKKGKKEQIEIPSDLVCYFDEKYAESNKRLSRLTGIDLKDLGYAVSSDSSK